MQKHQCKKCKKVRDVKDFYEREDTLGALYAWCIECCDNNGRSIDYPNEKERGGGVVQVNYHSLGKKRR